MNVDKLTPAPWSGPYGACDLDGNGYISLGVSGPDANDDDRELMCLARAALDVMVRRGWSLFKAGDGWYASEVYDSGIEPSGTPPWPDPFTAYVEADRWYRENVESKPVRS